MYGSYRSILQLRLSRSWLCRKVHPVPCTLYPPSRSWLWANGQLLPQRLECQSTLYPHIPSAHWATLPRHLSLSPLAYQHHLALTPLCTLGYST